MNIVFFGNADFGCNTLANLIESNYNVVGVVTNPDAKSGRSQNYASTPIKKVALEYKLHLLEKDNIKDKAFIENLSLLNADLFIVIAYKILPKEIYTLPKFGAVNIHASLLPQYKGSSPIQQALINGDKETGLSSFFIDSSIDGGDLIYQEKIDILDSDNFGNLWEKLSNLSGGFTRKTIDLIIKDKKELLVKKMPLSYAPKIKKDQLKINWSQSAMAIHNQVRAFSPYSCMYSILENKRVKLFKTKPFHSKSKKSLKPGQFFIDEGQIIVKCDEGYLQILELQPESKKRLSANQFLNGYLGLIKEYKFDN